MTYCVSGIRGGIKKPYRNWMVHLELRLKIKYSKAVSRFSLTRLFLKKTPKIKPSFIRHHRCIVFQFNAADSTIQLLLPLSSPIDRNAINRSDLARRELRNSILHQFYVQKNRSISSLKDSNSTSVTHAN